MSHERSGEPCCDKSDDPNIMDGDDGPVCHCGAPSDLQSGVCLPCYLHGFAKPQISCVMPTTAKRRWCIERSIRCWQKQTWENRELLVVGDGEESVADLVAPFTAQDPRIRYVHLDGERTLGMKYNECVERVAGPYIALWADDDWHHPQRLEAVIRAMQCEGTEIGGTNTMIQYRVRDKAVFHYWSPPMRPYVIGGTMIFNRLFWEDKVKFPNVASGSDTMFAWYLLWPHAEQDDTVAPIAFTMVTDPRLYIAIHHGANTGNPLEQTEGEKVWTKLEPGEVNFVKLCGADVAAEFGF